MQYMLMAYVNEGGFGNLTPEQQQQGLAAYGAYVEALQKSGAMKGSNRLRPSADATTVRMTDGKSQVLDGPYADSKEQLGGYFLIDVPDLDAAIFMGGAVSGDRSWSGGSPPNLGHAGVTAEGGELARDTAALVARRSYGKLVAFLVARTRDVAAAEDALAEAFMKALTDWPAKGCPANPEAWLLTVARRRIIDVFRGRRREEDATGQLEILSEGFEEGVSAAEIPDQRLALMFACTHPAIEAGVRAPLMLQAVLGLDAKTIASAFLASPAAMSKRLVRAKEKIRQAGIPFRVPEREELAERLGAVLDAVYAAFTEGWTDPAGADVVRRDLTEEALFLARLVTELLPAEPEALGLLALMLHAEARRRARREAFGEYVPLAEQDPALWDARMMAEAEAMLRRAGALGSIGRYQLEAALQSAHVYRCRTGVANWRAVVQLYDALFAIAGSPVVAINRALAVAEVDGAEAGLRAMPVMEDDARLTEYQPYWAARAELLSKSGAYEEARRAYEVAAGLERDPAVRRFLQKRQAALPA